MGEIDKHVSDGINKLHIENKCGLTSETCDTSQIAKTDDRRVSQHLAQAEGG